MRVRRFPEEHYEAISEAPVELKPFDPAGKRLALEYERALNQLLEPLGVTAQLFGSTALELLGKGEWEFALFLEDVTWSPAIAFLRDHFGHAHVLDDAFALFRNDIEGYEVEVIAMRGEVARWNQAIMRYWRENPDARAAYAAGKLEHAHSKRAYYRWKDELIAGILEQL